MSSSAPSIEAEVLVFEDGIPGFPDHHRFQLVDFVDEAAFQLLQSVDEDNMAMIVCSPWLSFPDYAPEITDDDEAGLGLDGPDEAIVFCPVTIEGPDNAYANLLGPFVVNSTTLQGRQVVLVDSAYEVRTALPFEV